MATRPSAGRRQQVRNGTAIGLILLLLLVVGASAVQLLQAS